MEHNMRAIWNGITIAKSDSTVVVEGNHYFPRDAVRDEYLQASDTHTICPWKGQASYLTLAAEGELSLDAAWYYPHPKPAANGVTDRIAFGQSVRVVADAADGDEDATFDVIVIGEIGR